MTMLRSIATVSISGTLPEKLAAISRAGFDGVEIFENDLLYYDGSPGDVRRMCADLGLRILLYQPFRDFEGVPADRLDRNLERARRKFELMHELGTDRVLVCSNVSAASIGDDALIVEQLGQLAELARSEGVTAGYEALAWGRRVNSYKHAWKLVDAVNHPSLGLVLDSFHTLSIDDSLDEIAAIPGERIAFVQIADAPKLAMDVLEWSRHYRCFPGQGDLDVSGFTRQVLASGYAGPLSLEIFNDGFRAAPNSATALDGYRSLLFLEEQCAGISNAELFNPPQAPDHAGFQFLEFAVDAASGATLAHWLSRMGFHAAGRHRSKSVMLYTQGDASILLNEETDSFASAFHQMHGLSVCASAFRVDNAAQAFKRAAAFGYAPFSGKVGPNERVVPSVQAPDNSLQYFVDEAPGEPTLYETDFNLDDARREPRPDDLRRIDHVCLNVPADALDTWILFFRSVFGFEVEAAQLLPDPYGLVRSRAVRSRDGSARIVLNASADRHTAVVESLSTYQGSGLNHVAFATHDIFATVARLRGQGVPLLGIPRNYYDDLDARHDLDPHLLERMRASSILYDRDASGGEFLQAYTEQFADRFFIEVVERRGAYDGYGAVNAPVRLAAHAQRRRL
jgi:4-hydroxyphenylpyruvate dioxygenase